MQMKLRSLALPGFVIAGAALVAAFPAMAGDPPAPPPLPSASGPTGGAVTQVVVSGGQRALFKIALPPLLGDGDLSKSIVETETRDFTQSSLFQVLDPQSFTANLAAEGTGIEPSSWRNVGAEGVIKGMTQLRSTGVHLEMSLYVVSRGREAVLKRDYDVPSKDEVRGAVHKFCNEVVKWFTGIPGSFGTRMVFSATTGRGQKGIYQIESDGQGLVRLTTATNVALAPAIGPGGVYYAGGNPDGTYALFKVGNPAAVLKHAGMIFGVAFGANKMALVISQGGQSDIYVGSMDGTNLTKVTSGGLNTHPSFGPSGQLAYVSNAGGNPQIYVDGKKVSSRGTYNMAPVWCNDPEGLKLLFMGRDGATWDIFSVAPSGDPATMKRLTQDQGSNTYPACAPDGRTIAFFSTRGGLYTANPSGLNQQKINNVQGESLRWESN
jgi:TolB protein